MTIAGSRLEIAMGQLWWQLDKDNVSEERTRKLGVDQQARAIRQSRDRGDPAGHPDPLARAWALRPLPPYGGSGR